MAAISSIIGAAALGTMAYSAYAGNQSRKDAAGAQGRAQRETNAQKATEAANERRKLVREERVRRARILQSGINTGTDGSSGEAGALGSLSTQLNSNLGFNAGTLARAGNISVFNQQAFDAGQDAAKFDQLYSMSSSIFQANGGFGAFKGMLNFSGQQPPAPVETRIIN